MAIDEVLKSVKNGEEGDFSLNITPEDFPQTQEEDICIRGASVGSQSTASQLFTLKMPKFAHSCLLRLAFQMGRSNEGSRYGRK